MFIQGSIIEGEFDSAMNEFSIQKVKNFTTESTLNENQFNQIYRYLKKHQHDKEGQIITLYDQMPVRLSKEEMNQLVSDLEKVMSMYH
nr:hypothetical protein [Neobacillus sp. Marseille-Q6967]